MICLNLRLNLRSRLRADAEVACGLISSQGLTSSSRSPEGVRLKSNRLLKASKLVVVFPEPGAQGSAWWRSVWYVVGECVVGGCVSRYAESVFRQPQIELKYADIRELVSDPRMSAEKFALVPARPDAPVSKGNAC